MLHEKGPQNRKNEVIALLSESVLLPEALYELGISRRRAMTLAAQCEIPPHIAQYLVVIVLQRGVSHPFCLVFRRYGAGIAEIPLLRGGVSHLYLACSPRGKRSEKGGIAPNWPC